MSGGPPTQSFTQRSLLRQEQDPRKVGIVVGATLGGTALIGLGLYAKHVYDSKNETPLMKKFRTSYKEDWLAQDTHSRYQKENYEYVSKNLKTLDKSYHNDPSLNSSIQELIDNGYWDDSIVHKINSRIKELSSKKKSTSFLDRFKRPKMREASPIDNSFVSKESQLGPGPDKSVQSVADMSSPLNFNPSSLSRESPFNIGSGIRGTEETEEVLSHMPI